MHADEISNVALGILTSVSLLVVVSIGLAVIFGVMRVINFAHGEFLMLGAFLTLAGAKAGIPLGLAMLLATAAMGVFGLLVERLLIRYLYGRIEATMLATFGLSLILVQVAVLIWGTSTQGLATPLGSFHIGRYSESTYRSLLIVAALAMLASVHLVFRRTRFGVMARATTQSPAMASAVGVNAARVNAITFAFGSALAGAGGALLAPIAAVAPSMGAAYVARAFMTVVVGGPSTVAGTAASAGLLGTIERTISDYATPFLGTAALLVVAIVVLRVMPTGLTGPRGRSR